MSFAEAMPFLSGLIMGFDAAHPTLLGLPGGNRRSAVVAHRPQIVL